MKTKILIYLSVLLLIIAGYKTFKHYSELGGVKRAGADYLYPTITGELNLAVNQGNINQTICKSGWTTEIRNANATLINSKRKQAGTTINQEWDHELSLELGGSPTSSNNLWSQDYPQARWKDRVETNLKNRICAGKITLKEAQRIITTDWYAEYLKIGGKLGAVNEPSRTDD